jgi:DNA-binding NarL/FixJ family response regulator
MLLLAGDARDADLIDRAIQLHNSHHTVVRVDSRAGFLRALKVFEPNVILCHAGGVSDCDGAEALRLTQERLPVSPFLLLAEAFEQRDSDCLKMGAWDCILRSDLSRLFPAIELAIEARVPLRRLSTRQREVLLLLALSCSTREIARRLSLSVKTVETHRAAVMKRLNIHQVANLVRYSLRVGLIHQHQSYALEHEIA